MAVAKNTSAKLALGPTQFLQSVVLRGEEQVADVDALLLSLSAHMSIRQSSPLVITPDKPVQPLM
jgi:hypothetical protein